MKTENRRMITMSDEDGESSFEGTFSMSAEEISQEDFEAITNMGIHMGFRLYQMAKEHLDEFDEQEKEFILAVLEECEE